MENERRISLFATRNQIGGTLEPTMEESKILVKYQWAILF